MTDKIQELAEEALAFAYKTCQDVGHEVSSLDIIYLSIVMGKYTDLLVERCAARVDHIARDPEQGGGTYGDDLREYFKGK